jgi:hypothetical protein
MADQCEYCYKCLCYINYGQFLVQVSEYQFTKRSANSTVTNTWLSICLNNSNDRQNYDETNEAYILGHLTCMGHFQGPGRDPI